MTLSYGLSVPVATRETIPLQSLHCLLRDATSVIHDRMHGHDGFHAIKNGTIDRTSYRKLLCRLYGFYKAFERETNLGDQRSGWLVQDLSALGLDAADYEKIAVCAEIPQLNTPNKRLGALYVVFGSSLGGRQLARSLDHLFQFNETAGRIFFLGHGAQTGAVWRDYLAELAEVSPDSDTQIEVINAASDTFAVFEQWASGWKD